MRLSLKLVKLWMGSLADICSFEIVKNKLSAYKRYEMAATPRVAAVLLPIIRRGDECFILFTKRVRGLQHHGGEVSFPGGLMEIEDKSLADTALRETYEEIGIATEDVEVFGELDDELSKGGHRVTPFVGLLKNQNYDIQATEVDKIYEVPVPYLIRKDVYYTERWIVDGVGREVHFYRYGNDIIWGLTARILSRFFDIVR